uniref:Secreted protein n=1 Tax=Ascaris lumbricoides TaxID=6252 RepID=A0A0M3HX81_ASCLU
MFFEVCLIPFLRSCFFAIYFQIHCDGFITERPGPRGSPRMRAVSLRLSRQHALVAKCVDFQTDSPMRA